jgi:hypothetical protein
MVLLFSADLRDASSPGYGPPLPGGAIRRTSVGGIEGPDISSVLETHANRDLAVSPPVNRITMRGGRCAAPFPLPGPGRIVVDGEEGPSSTASKKDSAESYRIGRKKPTLIRPASLSTRGKDRRCEWDRQHGLCGSHPIFQPIGRVASTSQRSLGNDRWISR